MPPIAIAGIVVAGVILFVVFAIILTRHNNKKRYKNLQNKLEKFNKENSEFEDDSDKITISSDEGLSEEQYVKEQSALASENVTEEPYLEENQPQPNVEDNQDFNFEDFLKELNGGKSSDRTIRNRNQVSQTAVEHDDFEDFLNQHSYTRRILDKDLLGQIQSLPKDVKALVLSGIFNRPQD